MNLLTSVLNRFTSKEQAFKVAKHAGTARELVEMKSGLVNTYVSPKERARKAKRKRIAKASRRRNR